MLPSVVARELDDDSELLAIECISLLRYSEAHRVYARGDKDEMKAWKGSHQMDLVTDNAFAMAAEELQPPTEGSA